MKYLRFLVLCFVFIFHVTSSVDEAQSSAVLESGFLVNQNELSKIVRDINGREVDNVASDDEYVSSKT